MKDAHGLTLSRNTLDENQTPLTVSLEQSDLQELPWQALTWVKSHPHDSTFKEYSLKPAPSSSPFKIKIPPLCPSQPSNKLSSMDPSAHPSGTETPPAEADGLHRRNIPSCSKPATRPFPMPEHFSEIPRGSVDANTPPPELHDASDSSDAFEMCCRCGAVSRSDTLQPQVIEGVELVQCVLCETWHHIACQRNGWAAILSKNETFICDTQCTPDEKALAWIDKGQTKKSNTKPSKLLYIPLSMFFSGVSLKVSRPGMDHSDGRFAWNVLFWRGCSFRRSPVLMTTNKIVSLWSEDVKDSMWQDRAGRRAMRLGKWTHALVHVAQNKEDLEYEGIDQFQYDKEVNNALTPHTELLEKLYRHPDLVDSSDVPALEHIRTSPNHLFNNVLPHCGSTSIEDRCRVSNWFETHISRDSHVRVQWMYLVPWSHIITLLIAYRLAIGKHDSGDKLQIGKDLLQEVWAIQVRETSQENARDFEGGPRRIVDVDNECLGDLERKMFECSARAGNTGYFQWGLDAGHHENNWNPYDGLPRAWTKHRYAVGAYDERILERGEAFIEWEEPAVGNIGRTESVPRTENGVTVAKTVSRKRKRKAEGDSECESEELTITVRQMKEAQGEETKRTVRRRKENQEALVSGEVGENEGKADRRPQKAIREPREGTCRSTQN
ncbi:hypothetical protein PM082_017589 [Marasmius tenuissimus]|nr:hypothetical protein PM082_017589 [Marasmius tenuissimus]